jgi:hypothetical protein
MAQYNELHIGDQVELLDPNEPEEISGTVEALNDGRALVNWGLELTWTDPKWLEIIQVKGEE